MDLNAVTNVGHLKTRIGIVDQKLGPQLEVQLRDRRHRVGTKGVTPTKDQRGVYRWHFDPEILVEPLPVIDPTKLPPPAKAAAATDETNRRHRLKLRHQPEPRHDSA